MAWFTTARVCHAARQLRSGGISVGRAETQHGRTWETERGLRRRVGASVLAESVTAG
jgi:hypothetical protein